MSIDYQNDRQSHCADVRSSTRDSNAESFASLVRPIIAGAQARGMADMLEMLELGAILIAADGAVLYASDRARRLTEAAIDVVAGHLRGQNAEMRAVLDRILGQVVAGKPAREVIATSERVIELRALMPHQKLTKTAAIGTAQDGQLLHCVLVVRPLGLRAQ